MSRRNIFFLFTKKRLFSLIIPVGIIIIISSIFTVSNFSKADSELTDKLSGKILLQVENSGEAWYLDPDSKSRLFLGRPSDAYRIMKEKGLGIKAQELANYLDSSFPKRLAGKILLSVEERGEAYYINPDDLKGYYLGIPQDAFNIMRELSLGINNEDIEKIEIYRENDNREGQEEEGSSSSGSSSANTNNKDNDINDDNENSQDEQTDNQEQNQETRKVAIETISPEPVFHFSNIMTVYASLGENDNTDNIKEWGIVWDYNNIPDVQIIPTIENNRYRVNGDINQLGNQERLGLDIAGLVPSTFPYIRSYLILEDDLVIYGNIEALYRYNQEEDEEGGLTGGSVNDGSNNISHSYSNITQGMPSTPSVSSPVYELTYRSGANGYLSGETSQTISSGQDASSITAIPDTGYLFSSWSDGVTTNPRTDHNIKSDLSVYAIWEASCPSTMTDDDGNVYDTVEIGNQCWMAENMNVGTLLSSAGTQPNNSDDVIEKWCYYDNDFGHCETNGAFYNWGEAMHGSTLEGAQGICPSGWHIPTDAQINELEVYTLGVINSPNPQYPCSISEEGQRRCADDSASDYGGTYGVGASLKSIGIGSGVGIGDDLVGFNGILPGMVSKNSSYEYRRTVFNMWSSTEVDNKAMGRGILSYFSTVLRKAYEKEYGFSVRCIKD